MIWFCSDNGPEGKNRRQAKQEASGEEKEAYMKEG